MGEPRVGCHSGTFRTHGAAANVWHSGDIQRIIEWDLKKKKEKKALESGVSPEQALHFFTSLHDTQPPNPNAAALPMLDRFTGRRGDPVCTQHKPCSPDRQPPGVQCMPITALYVLWYPEVLRGTIRYYVVPCGTYYTAHRSLDVRPDRLAEPAVPAHFCDCRASAVVSRRWERQDMAVEYTCGNVSMTVPCGERLLRSTTYLDKTTHQHKCACAPQRST